MPLALDLVSDEDWELTLLDQLEDDASYAGIFEEWIDVQDEKAAPSTPPLDVFEEVQELVPTYKQESDTESDSCSEFSDVRFITPTPPVPQPPPPQQSSSTSLTGKRKRDESEDSESDMCPRKSNKIPRRDKRPSSTPLALAPEIPQDILMGERLTITTEELKTLVDASEIVGGVPPKKFYWPALAPAPTRKCRASGSKQRRRIEAAFACIFCDSDFTRAAGMRNHYRGKTSHNFTTTDQDHFICQLGCKLRSGEVFYTYNKRDLTRHVEESRKHQDRMRELGLVTQNIADGDSDHSYL